MKALLTSGGISNSTIEAEMWRLLGGRRKGIKLLFIPTAYTMESPDGADWGSEDIEALRKMGFEVEVFDITGTQKSEWLPRFEAAEVYYFEGGSTGWLLKQIRACGLEEKLPELLKTHLWIGASAGSVVLCPTICNAVQDLFDEDDFAIAQTKQGLGLVDFVFVPHLNSEWFPKVRSENINSALKKLEVVDGKKLYACDDDGAVSVEDNKTKIVSEGQFIEIEL